MRTSIIFFNKFEVKLSKIIIYPTQKINILKTITIVCKIILCFIVICVLTHLFFFLKGKKKKTMQFFMLILNNYPV